MNARETRNSDGGAVGHDCAIGVPPWPLSELTIPVHTREMTRDEIVPDGREMRQRSLRSMVPAALCRVQQPHDLGFVEGRRKSDLVYVATSDHGVAHGAGERNQVGSVDGGVPRRRVGDDRYPDERIALRERHDIEMSGERLRDECPLRLKS